MSYLTKQQLDETVKAMESLSEKIEEAQRGWRELTGEYIRGELDWDEMTYSGRFLFHWRDWACGCLRDSGTDELPAQFVFDTEAFTAQWQAEQKAKQKEEARKKAAERRAKEKREREQLARLAAKYGQPKGAKSKTAGGADA